MIVFNIQPQEYGTALMLEPFTFNYDPRGSCNQAEQWEKPLLPPKVSEGWFFFNYSVQANLSAPQLIPLDNYTSTNKKY